MSIEHAKSIHLCISHAKLFKSFVAEYDQPLLSLYRTIHPFHQMIYSWTYETHIKQKNEKKRKKNQQKSGRDSRLCDDCKQRNKNLLCQI